MNCTDRWENKQHFGAHVYEAMRNFLTGFQLEVKAPENTSEKHSEIFMNHFINGLQGGVTMVICFMADMFGDMRPWSNRNNTFLHFCGV